MTYQKKYNTFRQTFPEIVFESYRYDVQSDGLHIIFAFRLNKELLFQPTAFIPARPFISFNLTKEQMDLLVFNIGMIELVSYWKAFCPPTVRVLPHGLTDRQVAFWKKIYFNGLGEFFYVNGIKASIDDFMTIVADGEPLKPIDFDNVTTCQTDGTHNYIVPIGGGKDSVVTLESLLRPSASHKRDCNVLPLVMNPRGATTQCCEVAGYGREEFIEIRRSIHPLLLDLNKKGALNGHTPFSAMLAFYSLLASALTGYANISLSNEGSANEATDLATGVNHQYSKSLEFEDDFRAYVAEFIALQFNYFSFLRPLSELQIAMLFATHNRYHDVFRSCNVGSKQDVWCGHCAKCLFAFIILSPFIEPQRLSTIFGHNLLDDESMSLFFRQLTGQEATKPFECVGTISEVNTALSMALERYYKDRRPLLLANYQQQTLSVQLNVLSLRNNLSGDEMALLAHLVTEASGKEVTYDTYE